MIKFSGEFSESSKDCLIKILARGLCFSLIIAVIIVGIFALSLIVMFQIWISIIFLVASLLTIIACSVIPFTKHERRKTLIKMLPQQIIIDEDDFIKVEWVDYNVKKNIADVKKIFDYGMCYLIKFKIPRGRAVFCQKDLIKEGTIENFEELFQEKIVRKVKNK